MAVRGVSLVTRMSFLDSFSVTPAARATSVLHYLIDSCAIAPQRLSAIGYGEYRPIDTNETKAGRAKNRRVEIIILPKEISKKSYEEMQSKISEEARNQEESKIGQEAVK